MRPTLPLILALSILPLPAAAAELPDALAASGDALIETARAVGGHLLFAAITAAYVFGAVFWEERAVRRRILPSQRRDRHAVVPLPFRPARSAAPTRSFSKQTQLTRQQ